MRRERLASIPLAACTRIFRNTKPSSGALPRRGCGASSCTRFIRAWRKIKNALRSVGPVRLILAHMGGWRCWDEVGETLADTGVLIDTSFSLGAMTPGSDGYYKTPRELALLDEERFVSLIRAFGSRRVLFGTDCPWGEQKAEIQKFLALPLTAEERDDILWGNGSHLLNIT